MDSKPDKVGIGYNTTASDYDDYYDDDDDDELFLRYDWPTRDVLPCF